METFRWPFPGAFDIVEDKDLNDPGAVFDVAEDDVSRGFFAGLAVLD